MCGLPLGGSSRYFQEAFLTIGKRVDGKRERGVSVVRQHHIHTASGKKFFDVKRRSFFVSIEFVY